MRMNTRGREFKNIGVKRHPGKFRVRTDHNLKNRFTANILGLGAVGLTLPWDPVFETDAGELS